MVPDYCYNFFYLVLLAASILGMLRFRMADTSLRIMGVYMVLSTLTEYVAYYAAVKYRSNMEVYSIYELCQFLLIALYFNYSIALFRRHYTGYWIGVGGVAAGIANIIYLQPLNTENYYFLFFEGIFTIGMVLFAFARIMIEGKEQNLLRNPHFWIGIILVFNWSLTFFNWGLYDYMYAKSRSYGTVLSISLLAVATITYIGFGLVFLQYPKWRSNAA